MQKSNLGNLGKVLIVDDNSNNLSVLGQLLRELNYKCEFALNGKEALNWLHKEDFDLVLLDVVMPVMDGYEVCEKIKSQEKWQHIPIIFITIKNDLESTIKGFEKGAVDYINKPFNSEELSVRISTQIELKRSRDQLKHYINELVEKNNYIVESIRYAQHIQKHILPDIELLNQYFSDQFIIYKPLQIVSGDFYWYKIFENNVIFSVVDCTGHGVPGALMSIAAYTALNQAVGENKLVNPSSIIKYAHKYLLSLFHKIKDVKFMEGMDITVCSLNTTTNKLLVSGARQKAIIFHENSLEILGGDNYSVGDTHAKSNKFSETQTVLHKGDTLYMQTDGIVDQFAENDGKKYGSRQYLEFLKSIVNKPMQEQQSLLIREHESWKGNTHQIDDITVWGLKY